MDRESLFASGCTTIVVVLVLLTPSQFVEAFSPGYWIGGGSGRVRQSSPVPEKQQRSVKPRPVEPQIEEAALSFPDVPVLPIPVLSELVEPKPKPAPFNVVKDTTFLYSLNHPDSPVVTTLPVGAIVLPQMQVYDGAQEWSFVKVPSLRVSGYLQTDWFELRSLDPEDSDSGLESELSVL